MLKFLRAYAQQAEDARKAEEPTAFKKVLSGVANVVHMGDPVFKVLSAPYHLFSTEVLSPIAHVPLVAGNLDWQRQINADSKWDALFDGRTWGEINDQSEKESWGRATTLNLRVIAEGIMDPDRLGQGTTDAELDKWRSEESFKYVSGTYDALGWIFADPLIVLGKGAKAAGLFKASKPAARTLERSEDFDEILAAEPVRKFLAWTEGKRPDLIREHPALRDSPQAGLIADLLSKASHNDKGLIYRIGLGDQAALDQLQREAPQLAASLSAMRGEHRYLQNELLPKTFMSAPDRADVLAQSKARADEFAEANATKLTLGRTEFNAGPAGLPAGAVDPFGITRARHTAGLGETTRAFNTVYTTSYVAENSRTLFRAGEAVPRNEAMVQAGLDELEKLERSARLLTDSRASFQRPGRSQSFPKGTTAAERRDMARGSGFKFDAKGEPTFRLYTSDELAEASQVGIHQRTIPDLPLKRDMPGMATKPAYLSDEMHAASLADEPVTRYPMFDYDPAEVTRIAEEVRGQTNILDDLITPEIGALDREIGGIRTAMQAADDIVNTPPSTGIFGQLDRLPKRGAYGNAANKIAERRFAKNERYVRGFGQLRHQGWLNRPVYIAQKMGDYVSRTASPVSYSPNDPEGWKALDGWLRSVKGFPAATRMALVRDHMGLTDETSKLQHVQRAEAAAMEHMMRRNGITDDKLITNVVLRTLGQRQALVGRMADSIRGRGEMPGAYGSADGSYSGAVDDAGVRVDALERDGTATVVSPMLRTQLLNNHPLLPVEELERALWRDRHMFRGSSAVWGTADNIMEFTQLGNKIWKGSVLMRFGYPFRTVSDEALMSLATMDALAYMSGAVQGPMNMVRNLPARARNARKWEVNRRKRELGELPDEVPERLPALRGDRSVRVGGMRAHGFAQGPRGDIYRGLTSTDQRDLWGVYDRNLADLRTHASWGVLDPAKGDDHIAAWQHALNQQFSRDELARQALAGHSVDDMVSWLKTPAGKRYAAGNQLVSGRSRQWVQSVYAMVDQYTVGMPEIRQAALAGKADLDTLKAVPMELRPTVHGGQIDYTLGLHGWNAQLNRVLNGFYKVANKLPTDALVRHPVADLFYQRRLRELVGSAKAQGYDLASRPDRLYQMEEIARQFTVKQMHLMFKDHLFDTPQTALRFMMPFFGAWRGAIARWGRAIGEDPSTIARLNSGWQGLHKPFDMVDENGMPVEDHEQNYGLNTKNNIVVRLPEWAVKKLKIPYAPAATVPLRSFNTILQGDPWYNPGFGPLMTIPVSEIVRNRPELGALAKPVLPYGARDLKQNLLPTFAQRVDASQAGLDNRGYAMTYINIMRTEITRYNMGERKAPPTADEIRKKAGHLTKLRAWASFTLPVSVTPLHYSKEWEGGRTDGYQFLAGKFRDYRERYGEEGEEKFLNEFPEAWAYLESTSRNVSGIPANRRSWDKSKRVKDLMKTAPDIFPSVANIREWDREGFDRDVYTAQFGSEFNPNTGQNMRESGDPLAFYHNAKVGMGWKMYGKMMDLLRAQMDNRGLQTLEGPSAKDLADIKREGVAVIRQQFPDWYDEYSTGGDPARRRRILEQAAVVAKDSKLSRDQTRPDIQTLGAYLAARQAIAKALQARDAASESGSIDITAKSNSDILTVWNQAKDTLNQTDLMFAELWGDRYFAHDNLQELVR